MLIAIDVGNTTTHVGIFRGRRLARTFRIPTDRGMPPALGKKLRGGRPDAVVISTVVPVLKRPLARMFGAAFSQTPLFVGPKIRLPIRLGMKNLRGVGADRIANTVAAFVTYGSPCLVVDAGTATTVDFVDGHGVFRGGAIAPGLATAASALSEKGAQLPRPHLKTPGRAVGRDTHEAMLSGLIYGYAALVDGLIGRIQKEVGPIPRGRTILTGGDAPLLKKILKVRCRYVPELTLRGLALLARMNAIPGS